MLLQTIISLTVIIVLTVVMSFMLVKVIKQVNRQSKEYFEKKIVVYDDVIDEKQKRLEAIDHQLNSQKGASQVKDRVESPKERNVIVLNEKLPDYKIEGLLRQAKLIEDRFQLDKESAVRSFVEKHNVETSHNQSLDSLYHQLAGKDSYRYHTSNKIKGWDDILPLLDISAKKLLRPYVVGNPSANLGDILSYIRLELDKSNPQIIIETGDKNDNFSHIYRNIQTIYNPDIYLGIRIFYQDRMYDYSLRGEI